MDGHPAKVLAELSLDQGQSISGEADWRESVTAVLLAHEEATHPDWGWPWPWDDSRTTDYAYAFTHDAGSVLVSCFGTEWMHHWIYLSLNDEDENSLQRDVQEFPDMSAIKAIRWDTGNAPFVIGGQGIQNETYPPMNRPKEK